MSLLDINLDDVPDLTTVEDGEYELRITSAQVKKSKKGSDMIALSFSVEGEPDAQSIFHYLVLPTADDDEATSNNKLRRIRDFCKAFGINYSDGIDTESMKGESGYAILSLEEDAEYGDRNVVKRFVQSN